MDAREDTGILDYSVAQVTGVRRDIRTELWTDGWTGTGLYGATIRTGVINGIVVHLTVWV